MNKYLKWKSDDKAPTTIKPCKNDYPRWSVGFIGARVAKHDVTDNSEFIQTLPENYFIRPTWPLFQTKQGQHKSPISLVSINEKNVNKYLQTKIRSS